MSLVRDILQQRNSLFYVEEGDSVAAVVRRMAELSVGAIMVMGSGELRGVFSERDLMRRELGANIAKALQKLTPRERMVFELKHYHGLKLRTVGEILHTTEETAKNTLFRATQKLRGSLADMR